ncbi:TPA: DUF1482 family protein [Citrobacter farmeri]|nr:DUF1482 family protein [Citrobacter farmeri]
MNTLYALVLTIAMANGDFQEGIIGVYGSKEQCESAASVQSSITDCYPLEGIVQNGELPKHFKDR